MDEYRIQIDALCKEHTDYTSLNELLSDIVDVIDNVKLRTEREDDCGVANALNSIILLCDDLKKIAQKLSVPA